MNFSSITMKAIASSVILGLAALVALFSSSSTDMSIIPSFRNLEGGGELSAFSSIKPTGFYTSDIAFFTVKPWGPASWSLDFDTKSIKKLNSLLYAADGEENHKGSILCTDELCQGHGKATTAVLTGTGGETTATFEIGADAFELCITCPPGETLQSLTVDSCMTDLPLAADATCTVNEDFFILPATIDGTFRTGIIQFRDQEEPMPNIVRMTITYMCA